MSKPNQDQVDAGIAILKAHITNYGNTAAETRLSSTIYAIYAAMTGDAEPAEEHAASMEAARQAKKPKVEEADGEVKAADEKSKSDEAAIAAKKQAALDAAAKEKADAVEAAEKAKAAKAAKAEEEAAAAATMPPSKQANKATSE